MAKFSDMTDEEIRAEAERLRARFRQAHRKAGVPHGLHERLAAADRDDAWLFARQWSLLDTDE